MNIIRILGLGAAALLVVAGAPVAAQSASDVRCVLVSNVFMNAPGQDAKAKRIAEAAAYYYLGRLDRFPPAQLRAALATERKALTPAMLAQTMNGCARTMAASGKGFDGLLRPPGAVAGKPASQPARAR